MSKDSRRRFATVEALKKFTPDRLRDFLYEFPDDINCEDGLADELGKKDLPYERLVEFFMNKRGKRSEEILTAIFYINALATKGGKAQIRAQAKRDGIKIVVPEKCPVHDYVFFAWKAGRGKDLLVKAFVRGAGQRKRGAVTFETDGGSGPGWDAAGFQAFKAAFELAMDKHFLGDQEGGGTEITAYPDDERAADGDTAGQAQTDGEVWCLIRRGGELTRQGIIKGNKGRSTVEFTPELYDAGVYCPKFGELRVYAPVKDRDAYRQQFGFLIGKSAGFFGRRGLVTLDPLKSGKRSAIRLEGFEKRIKWIRFVELRWRVEGDDKEYFVHHGRDLFDLVLEPDPGNGLEGVPLVPSGMVLEQAVFRVKFRGSDPARTLAIVPPDLARYTRCDDAGTLEEWLRVRGFKVRGEATLA